MQSQLSDFVVADASRCIGCRVCEVACAVAHTATGKEHPVAGNLDSPLLPRLYLVRTPLATAPVQCRHCEDAPCAASCPAGAIRRKDGALVVEEARCVGCKTCMLACPFGAVELVPVYAQGRAVMQTVQTEDGGVCTVSPVMVAVKCDMCIGRQAGPACVQACPRGALRMAAVSDLRRRRCAQAAAGLAKYVTALHPEDGRS